MRYTIEFYDGDVAKTILCWPVEINARFTRITLRMVGHGANLGMPYTRAMGGGLFEIRAKRQEGIRRAFFCTLAGRCIVTLHGFIKKTDKTPKPDIALQRMKEIKHG